MYNINKLMKKRKEYSRNYATHSVIRNESAPAHNCEQRAKRDR